MKISQCDLFTKNKGLSEIKIFAKDRNGDEFEITNLYWFEEQGIQTFQDLGYNGFTFRIELYIQII